MTVTKLSDVLEAQTKEIIKKLSPNTRVWLEYIAAKNEMFVFDIVYERLQYFRYMSENERKIQLQKEKVRRAQREGRIGQRSICNQTDNE